MPMTAEMMASVQMARCGREVLAVQHAEVAGDFFVAAHGVGDAGAGVRQESVVPIRARKTVDAWIIMNHQPRGRCRMPRRRQAASCRRSGPTSPRRWRSCSSCFEEVVGREVFEQVAEAALDDQREDNGLGDVALGVLGFFAHRGDRLEADQDQDGDTGLDDHEAEAVGETTEAAVGCQLKVVTVFFGSLGSGAVVNALAAE